MGEVIMDKSSWENLSFFEQLSNIDGDVERMIRAHKKYLDGDSEVDNGFFYLRNIKKLITMTFMDPKNYVKGYRVIEIMDEYESLKEYLNGEYDEDYVRRYWNQYTRAIS